MTDVDVIILGAGAAGLMCAIEAGRRGRRVLVIDHADSPGKKILISGGGRCNFTNRNTTPESFLSANSHFAKSALARFTPQDFIAMVEKQGIAYHEKTRGQLFCDRSAHDILHLLLSECGAANVRIQTATRILSVTRNSGALSSRGVCFQVETSAGLVAADSLVVATGGLSIPKMGATAFGYELAKQFGHRIVETRPGLVPLLFNSQDHKAWDDLAGVSTEVVASLVLQNLSKIKPARISFREKMLFTHKGLSGPAILQISSYWRPDNMIELDLAPDHTSSITSLIRHNAKRDIAAVSQTLRRILPARMGDRWLALYATRSHHKSTLDALSNVELGKMEHDLHAWNITPAGTEGYDKAEVTVGGVDTDELDAKTMQSRKVANLYFIGEVVDVTGWLGGYNFQWAWASGVSAGRFA